MKALVLVALCAAGAGAAHFHPCLLAHFSAGESCSDGSGYDAGATPSGTYVEARSATVYAGACHYNAEVQSQGRQALVGWSFAGGGYAGESFAGLAVAAAVSSETNLKEGAERTAVVYLDENASAGQRDALLGWLQVHAAETLGSIVATHVAPVRFRADGDDYILSAGDDLELDLVAMPDRSCCSMPENRWYEPLGTVRDSVVGKSRACRFAGGEGQPQWSYVDANNAFVAAFGMREAASTEGCCAESSRAALAQ